MKPTEEPAIKQRGRFKREFENKEEDKCGGNRREETVCAVRVRGQMYMRYQEERTQECRPSKGSEEGRGNGEKNMRVT